MLNAVIHDMGDAMPHMGAVLTPMVPPLACLRCPSACIITCSASCAPLSPSHTPTHWGATPVRAMSSHLRPSYHLGRDPIHHLGIHPSLLRHPIQGSGVRL